MKPLHISARARRILLAVAIVVILLVLFGFFGLPPIVRSQAEKRLSTELDRTVTIEKVRINPLVLAATIEGFTIVDRDGGPFVSWRRFHANFDSFSLFTGDWRFSEIALDGLRTRVAVHEDGTLNIADLLDRPSPPETEDDDEPRPLFVRELVVSDAQLTFTDASRSEPFETQLGPLEFTLEDFRTAGGDAAPYAFQAQTEAGEALGWRGTLSVDPLGSAGSFDLRNLLLPKYAPYYRDLVEFDLRDGALDVSGRYSLDLASGAPRLIWQDGAVAIRNLRIALRDTQDPMVELGAFDMQGIQLDMPDPAHPAGTIGRVALNGLHVLALRDEDGINLLRALPTTGTESPASPDASAATTAGVEPGSFPAVSIGEIDLSGARIEWTDHTLPSSPSLAVEDLTINLRELDLGTPERRLPLQVSARIATGGEFQVQGDVSLLPFAATLTTQVNEFALSAGSPYVESLAPLRLTDGRLQVEGTAELVDGVARFSGDVTVAQLRTEDTTGAPLAGWDAFEINGASVTSSPLGAQVELVRLVKPTAHVSIDPEGNLNVSRITGGEEATAPAQEPAKDEASAGTPEPQPGPQPEPQPAAPLPDVTVARIELVDAEVHFQDQSIDPAPQLALQAFGGTITGLSSASGTRAQMDLKGQVTGGAPIQIKGQLNPLSRPPFADLTVDFQNLDLSPIGPYVAKYAGYRLNGGTLTLDVDADMTNWQLNSQNIVTLEQFTLGEKSNSPDATTLPVQLGLSLLRDREGKIVLEIPIRGQVNDPSFSVGPVVSRVITNLLTRAATSPFSLLGSMFGGGGEELSFQVFQPGAADIAPDQLQKLETVARALNERPGLKLEVRGSFDPAIDREALQARRLEEELVAAIAFSGDAQDASAEPDPALRLEALTELFQEAFSPTSPQAETGGTAVAEVEKSPETPAVSDEDPSLRRRFSRWVRRVLGRPVDEQPAATPIEPDATADAPMVDGTAATAPDAAGQQQPPTPEEMFQRLADRIPVTQEDLQQLAHARADWVRAYLVDTGGIEPGRVSVVEPSSEGSRVNLGLK